MHRGPSALATFFVLAGGALFLLPLLCERCGMDNAYLGEFALAFTLVVVGVGTAVLWALVSRREGRRGLMIGGPIGLAAGAVILALGATRTLVPPQLSLVELVLLVAGTVATIALARRKPQAAV